MQLENREVFAKNLKKFIEISGKDRKEIANVLGIPYSTFTEWANGRKYPRIDNIEKLSDYFGVSKSDFIEDFGEVQKDNEELVDLIARLRIDEYLFRVVKMIEALDNRHIIELEKILLIFSKKS